MSLISRRGLLQRIRRGKQARAQLVASNLSEGIAFQIRATRDAQEMTQAELARESGMTANNLSRLESPDYGKQTISSLKRIADALDVALVVRFVPFSQYIDWLSGTPRTDEGISPSSLAVYSFEKEEEENLLEERVGQGLALNTSAGIQMDVQFCIISTSATSTLYAGIPVTYEQSQPTSVIKELAGVKELLGSGYVSPPLPVIGGLHQSNSEENHVRA
jgi:transcriptional regulator with XRE-family HTH domain